MKDDEEDVVDDDDGDDVEFEENEELIDMFHVVLMKEKSEHHCLEKRKIIKIKFVLVFIFKKTHHFVDDMHLHLSIKVLV